MPASKVGFRGVGRRGLALVAVLVAIVSAAACKPHPYSSSVDKNTYVMGESILPSQMANMNPFAITGNWAPLFRYLYDSLYFFNPVDGKLTPDLARIGTWNRAHTIYRVPLRSGVTWQDGKQLTAADVVYTFGVLKKYAQADKYGIWAHLSDVEASPGGVTFHLKEPFEGLPYLLSQIYIVPEHIWSQAGSPLENRNMKPIGSGPYALDSYQNGVAINLKRNPHYFAGTAKLDKLVISMYTNSSALTLALQKGSINTTTGTIAMPSLPVLLKTKTNHLQKFPGLSVYSVLENNERAGLSNVLVRRAIQRSIDQKALIEKGELNGVVRQNPGWLPPTFSSYVDQGVYNDKKYSYDPEAAKDLLKQAGYELNSSGVAEKDGKELSFDYYEPSGAPAQEKEASMIRGWLRDIGIKTRARLVTGPEMTKIAATGDYDLMQFGTGVPPDPVQSIAAAFSSKNTAPEGKTTPGLNYSRFRDKELDSILDQASRTIDQAQLRKLLGRAQRIVADAAPVAVMYNVGGHLLYRTDRYTGYDEAFPVYAPQSLMKVQAK
ncbi:MAG TPA: ABC transporter substrate-binding protein [Mycobacteriales bacterium]|nr:ABC transporter substrate-binding protein [Mycobacteriales bacterium]